MITLVSIVLYFAAIFFAAVTGFTASKFKDGEANKANKAEGRFAVGLTALSFMMAAILQVCS